MCNRFVVWANQQTTEGPIVLTRQEILNKILQEKYSADNDSADELLEEKLR